MIDRLKSKKGHAIAKFNGRFLCSSVDPVKEAEDWVKKLGRSVQNIKTVIVMGVGCGYHLAQLRRSLPGATILAVDFHADLFEFSESVHSMEWANIRNVVLADTNPLEECDEIRKAIQDSYVVVHFAPATMTDAQRYHDAALFLLGRTWAGFEFVMRERSRLSNLFQNTTRVVPDDNSPLLSIKSLCERLGPQECRESMLLKALRELVV